jgi:hypothetical protein
MQLIGLNVGEVTLRSPAGGREWMAGHGVRQVSIPRVHQRRKVESPNKPEHANGFKHLRLDGIGLPREESDFLNEIKGACEQACVQLTTPSENSHSANDVASSSGGP